MPPQAAASPGSSLARAPTATTSPAKSHPDVSPAVLTRAGVLWSVGLRATARTRTRTENDEGRASQTGDAWSPSPG
ncbi:hypothetical protein VTG60DRAFT_701 [Thermothelomyces hinnuleus]